MCNSVRQLREFNNFRLHVEEKGLWYENEPISLPDKAIEVLIELTSAPGEIVKKDTLTATIWPETDGAENSLTQAVHVLRKAFRQYGEANLIKTIPRRGYRFVGEVIETVDGKQLAPRVSVAHPVTEVATVSPLSSDGERPIGDASHLITQGNEAQPFRFAAVGGLLFVVVLLAGIGVWSFGGFGGQGAFSSINSIAVLPFTSSGEVDEGLRMRITDSVITRLSELDRIRVRPTSVIRRFAGSTDDPVTLGKQLQVDAVFDGIVVIENNVLSVELRAIATNSGEQIWSDRFIGEPDRLLALQDAISERVLAALRSKVPNRDPLRLAKNPTDNAEAYENYLKGRYFWQRRTFDGLKNAIAYYQRSIELDPAFASAYVGLADSYYLLYDYNYDPSKENVDRAKSNLNRALELDPNSEEAYVTLGLIYGTYEWDWEKAGRSFDAAIHIRPDSADAYHRRAMMYLKQREFEMAESDMRRAVELEPTSLGINMNMGLVLFFSGRDDEAIKQFRSTIELEGNLPAPKWYLARCLWRSGRIDRAMDAYLEAMRSSGGNDLADQIAERRKTDDVDSILAFWIAEWKKAGVGEHSLAILSSHLKDKTATLELLNRAVVSRHPWASSIYAEPEFSFLNDEAEFQALISQLGFTGPNSE